MGYNCKRRIIERVPSELYLSRAKRWRFIGHKTRAREADSTQDLRVLVKIKAMAPGIIQWRSKQIPYYNYRTMRELNSAAFSDCPEALHSLMTALKAVWLGFRPRANMDSRRFAAFSHCPQLAHALMTELKVMVLGSKPRRAMESKSSTAFSHKPPFLSQAPIAAFTDITLGRSPKSIKES